MDTWQNPCRKTGSVNFCNLTENCADENVNIHSFTERLLGQARFQCAANGAER